MPHRNIASFLVFVMVLQILTPVPGYALSGGNKAPEFESFQPFGLDNMVDPATGDFSYNIPLMNIGFHGINLFYQAGITMDQEATMVGLGWNINSGMINRTVRGVPDDFKGDVITKEMSTKPYITAGLTPGVGLEIFGIDGLGLSASAGAYVNSYNGIGFEFSVSPSLSFAEKGESGLTAGLGLSASTDGGASLSPNVSYKIGNDSKSKLFKGSTFGIGTSINSRGGLKSLSLSGSLGIGEKLNIIPTSFSSSISFAKPSFIPQIEFPQQNVGFSTSGSVGIEAAGTFTEITGSGYWSYQSIIEKQLDVKAFGFLYSESATPDAIQDFHRAQDIPQSEDVPNLAIPMMDPDVYSVSGPGLSGTFQIARGDLGVVRDRVYHFRSGDVAAGVEVGPGAAYAHVGGDITTNISKTESNTWGSMLDIPMNFKPPVDNQKNFENAYFKKSDESSIEILNNSDLFSQIKGKSPLRAKINKVGNIDYSVNGILTSSDISVNDFNMVGNEGARNSREKRTNNISYKTFSEAEQNGFSRYINRVTLGNNNMNVFSSLLTDNYAQGHHIAEIVVENEDGYKYIYGLPSYSISQTEQTFSVDEVNSRVAREKSWGNGLINFSPNSDNSISNEKGIDHYYTSTTINGFASTYLLTAIVSSDYQDLTENGPTSDDYGDFVRFDYEKLESYHWKTPTSKTGSQASLSIGLIADDEDNKGHIIYGTRESYRPSTINNKTEIAQYHYYDEVERLDAKGEFPDGAKEPNPMKALKSVSKYNYEDYSLNLTGAEKLKSVHFEYDYSLCPGVYNKAVNGNGKLTLKKVYILNGESSKGRFSPYEFTYSDLNPSYSPKAVNRWGGYQPRVIGNVNDSDPVCNSTICNDLTTVDFPYVPQSNVELQDSFASAWNLSSIKLPSGGIIDVKYEADDYAYVQDKDVMQMIPISGVSTGPNFTAGEILKSSISHNFLHFKIEDQAVIDSLAKYPLDINQRKRIIEQNFIRDLETKHIYARVYGELKPNNSFGDQVEEYVPVWFKIKDFGCLPSNTNHAYLELEPVCLKDRKKTNCNNSINPIQKALMQTLRLNLPDYLYGSNTFNADDSSESGALNTILALGSVLTQITQFVTGVNWWMNQRGYGNKIDLSKSFVRLYNPSKLKLAGSHRVHSITMSDNFGTMTGGIHSNGVYGKKYEYTISENHLDGQRKISSGVAAYEPIVGGDENPFFEAVAFKEELLLAPDNTKYQTKPLMEDYFPSPQIIYSNVTTRDLYSPTNDKHRMEIYERTGFSQTQFYTYKDYPIKTKQTDKEFGDPYRSPKVIQLLKLKSKDYYTASQGYYIHNSLMHGKPKANYIYNSGGQLISGQEQFYKESQNGDLDFNIKALQKSSQGVEIVDARMGLEYKMFADTREHISKLNTYGATGNTDVIPVLGIPGPILTIYPKYADVEKRFRSIVLVKSMRQNGILYKTKAINGPAEIITEHLLWDAETAQPIVSKTTNEFEDPIYTINLLAHLAYNQMGLTYQNSAATFSGVNASEGNVTNNNSLIQTATEGDRVSYVTLGANFEYDEAWVLRKTSNSIFLIDKDGVPVSFSNKDVKIIDSGFSNQGSASIASYITRENPIVNGTLIIDESKLIIDASATSYKDQWQTFCNAFDSFAKSEPVGPNLILDGSFESGISSSFSSMYEEIYGDDPIEPGQFIIGENTGLVHPAWDTCITQFGSQMMIVDTDPDNNKYVWCQEINVEPNSDYFFGLHVMNANSRLLDIQLRLLLDFNPISEPFGPIVTPDQSDASIPTCNWDHFSTTWRSNADNQVTLCIENVVAVSVGYDFAIDNIEVYKLESRNDKTCAFEINDTINPYLNNIKGNWRPLKSYVFQTDRTSTNNIQSDGSYYTEPNNYNNTFSNFWQNGNNGLVASSGPWTWTNENTMVSPLGMELEARDPLNRYSAELSGYNYTKVVAVAANAKYNEIAYYGGEVPLDNGTDTYGLAMSSELNSALPSNSCRPKYHFNLIDGEIIHYTDDKLPNSGNSCIKFTSGENKILEFQTRPLDNQPCEEMNSGPYIIQECDCLPVFEPTEGKEYFLSAWLNDACLQSDGCNEMPYINVKSGNNSYKIDTYGPLIEGWRKLEGRFMVNSNDGEGIITLKDFGNSIYMDDIRIHPYHASMKTYNYDLKTLRFTFEHDDNNYFTRYDYADDGTLARISKQTARGVQTLQESTFGQQKAN